MASSFSSHGFNSSKMSRSTLQSASMPCHAFVASFLGWWIRQVFFHSPSGRKSTNQLGDHLSANFWDHYSIVAPQKTSCLVEILDTPKLSNTHGSFSPWNGGFMKRSSVRDPEQESCEVPISIPIFSSPNSPIWCWVSCNFSCLKSWSNGQIVLCARSVPILDGEITQGSPWTACPSQPPRRSHDSDFVVRSSCDSKPQAISCSSQGLGNPTPQRPLGKWQ